MKDIARFKAQYDSSHEDTALQTRGAFIRKFPLHSLDKLTVDEYSLPFLPCTVPEKVVFNLEIKKSDPPQVRSLTLGERDLLIEGDEDEELFDRAWKLSFVKFTAERLKTRLAAWSVPLGQMELKCDQKLDPSVEYRLPKGFHIGWPEA
jgi:hypothetical protein